VKVIRNSGNVEQLCFNGESEFVVGKSDTYFDVVGVCGGGSAAGSDELGGAAIAGLVVGAVFIVAGAVVILVACFRRQGGIDRAGYDLQSGLQSGQDPIYTS
jgi:hypothetical protein